MADSSISIAEQNTKNVNANEENSRRRKQFKWTTEMVADMLQCLKTYKVKMYFQGLDFDSDRPSQILEVRKAMAKLYAEERIFSVVEVTACDLPLQELSEDETNLYLKPKKKETSRIQRGHQGIQEKIKEIRQTCAKAATAGTRSGSGHIVYDFYDDLISIWGGSAASKPLSFGASSAMIASQDSSNEGESSNSSCSLFQSDDEKSQGQESNSQMDNTFIGFGKWPAVSSVPQLNNNKRRHMEKSLSAAQRDQLLFTEAKEDKARTCQFFAGVISNG